MIKKVFASLILVCCVVFGFTKSENNKYKSQEIEAQNFKITKLNYNQLKPYLEKKDGNTYVINFWATWCGPCVKELPYFEYITQNYASKNVEVLLVSLDFPNQIDTKLVPFIKKKKLKSKVVLLDDANENFWINAIDPSWSGAIPATIIYNKSKRKFYEKSFTKEELIKEIETFTSK